MNQENPHQLSQFYTSEDVVIVGVLNWGLGHASRCVPLIKWLEQNCKQVILASDGTALALLKREFPHLSIEPLRGYDISYRYDSIFANIIFSLFTMIRGIVSENSSAKRLVKKYNATVILSDNRLGFRDNNTKSFYLTHQVNILHDCRLLSYLGTSIHRFFIKKFDMCFVPDFEGSAAISPALSQGQGINSFYLGPLTRIKKLTLEKSVDICVILSGPETQRTILESMLLPQLEVMDGFNIHFVRGTDTPIVKKTDNNSHLKICDILTSTEIEILLNTSKLMIARSGYSTIMDIFNLDLKAILIPTPGQTEQEYLAKELEKYPMYKKLNQNEIKKLPEIIRTMIKS